MSQQSVFGGAEMDTYIRVERAATGVVEHYRVQFSGEYDEAGEAIYLNVPITPAEYERENN